VDDRTAPGSEPADDQAFDRLRSADPASDATPDLTRVRAAVTAATGVPLGGAESEVTSVETIAVDELAARRSRRTPRWLQVAAVAAGVVIIGGGSYGLGTAHGDAAPAAAPAIALGSPEGGAAAGSGAAAPSRSGASTADSKLAGYGFGRQVFIAGDLSTDTTSGKAWAFDAASVYSQDTLVRAATALGVTGAPRLEYGTWTVGANDGTAPSVSLSPDGQASVSYYDPTRDPWTCVRSAPDSIAPAEGSGSSVSGSDGVALPEPQSSVGTGSGTCDSVAPAPGSEAAIALAKDTMTALGVDPAGYEFDAASDPSTTQVVTVTGYQVVDGQRTGAAWSFTVVDSGVQSLYGTLAPLVELGTYDVISPAAAVARLGDPRFGPSYGGIMPMAADAMAKSADSAVGSDTAIAPSADPTVPATPAAGSPIGWPVQEVTIVSARLGLAVTTLPSGAAVLVPTYELTDADGGTWSVIAVADDALDFSAAG